MPSVNPLIIRSDYTVLLDENRPLAEAARDQLSRFAELMKRPGAIHTYRITPLSLWNAAAEGMTPEQMIQTLETYARYGVPEQVREWVHRLAGRYGELRLEPKADGKLRLSGSISLLNEVESSGLLSASGIERDGNGWSVPAELRGELKRGLTKIGCPVLDLAGYREGEALNVSLRSRFPGGGEFRLRDYQRRAVELFYREGSVQGGSGVVVLPCGAGKTVVGAAALASLGRAALIITAGVTSVKQWKQELLHKTTLTEEQIGEYAGTVKQVRPVTIATYQMLTNRKREGSEYDHFKLFGERDWGLIIYDEVHLLPAPVFRMTADLQATRRLGLTATLVREDGLAEDVFSLIGPKLFEMSWKKLELDGWIAAVQCEEIRIPLSGEAVRQYDAASDRTKHRIAGENRAKIKVVRELLSRHPGKPAIVIGQYLDQLRAVGRELDAPVLTGETPQNERIELYHSFKRGDIPVLVVSKVANFAVDLPDAAVAIQVSGSFGSRQEEAQRIGRILRPKPGDNRAFFYSLVTSGTKETEFALKRQLFMVEQGYQYGITDAGSTSADGESENCERSSLLKLREAAN
ncbi:DNA repair helicase XPB [Paenibacillus beijingensis]|uniref:DNA 3'-5' helicase n=1 Tax=Paenibacillus beijingensis TaxID=1126833 RepID=A0A0D5NN56_9BACL|nr:DNA repair helicase XPB [Paenibacillus beijingensis]AJY76442.1 helicase [Paenibacillus beijingensis]